MVSWSDSRSSSRGRLKVVGGLGTLDHGTLKSDCKLSAMVLFNTKFVPELADSCYTNRQHKRPYKETCIQWRRKKGGWGGEKGRRNKTVSEQVSAPLDLTYLNNK